MNRVVIFATIVSTVGAEFYPVCEPCVLVVNAIKGTGKSSTVKEAEKKSCNLVLRNNLLCNSAVEVVGMYLKWTAADKICAAFELCSPTGDRKLFKSPVRFSSLDQPDEKTSRVLNILNTDEFPAARFSRQAVSESSELTAIFDYWKQLLDRFQKAIEAYLD